MKVFIDRRLSDGAQNQIICSEGYNFGYGVFETIKVQDEKLVLFNRHMKRLESALALLEVNMTMSIDELESDSYKLIKENKLRDGALKIVVSKSADSSHVIISTRASSYTEDMYKDGFKLSISRVKRNQDSIIPYIKSLNYMENIIERKEALGRGYDDCLFLNTRGHLAETSISNIFFIKDEVIMTPKVSTGILDGIVRSTIIKIARSLNFDVLEGEFNLMDIAGAEEVFVTNSLMGVMPVSRLDDRDYNLSRNSLTRLLRAEYEKMISVEGYE